MGDGTRTRDTRNHNPMLYQLNYTHHRETAGKLARLKFGRSADLPGASSPAKVPSEEGEALAKPDSRQGCLLPSHAETLSKVPTLDNWHA